MNGDVGKLPSGAVYNISSDSVAENSTMPEYATVNGITDRAEALSPLPSAAPPDNGMQPSLPLSQLKHMLSQQLEYYFSRENLANDTYLLSQMDNDQYVPIWTVANFNQVKKLTKDIKLITEVLRESPNVQVDDDGLKVRPNHKRCIVILREIPDNTPIEDIKNLFSGENCPRFISCEFAHNNSWYVTFESGDDAQGAYTYLREEVREFQGRPIKARIKAKPMNYMPIPPLPFKNGYRVTPPSTAVCDPATFPPGQQRFLFANGTPGQQVSYTNQVHVYQPYQQQQPYYTSVVQAWPTSAGGQYYDISSVFQVNGLSPQAFKPQPYRPSLRLRKPNNRAPLAQSDINSQTPPINMNPINRHIPVHVPPSLSPPQTVSKSPNLISKPPVFCDSSRAGHIPQNANDDSHSTSMPIGVIQPDVLEDGTVLYRPLLVSPITINKEPLAPRHRRKRKEDEIGTNSTLPGLQPPQSPEGFVHRVGPKFDLEDSAFPPLPEHSGTMPPVRPNLTLNTDILTSHQVSLDVHTHWCENRLADVVKGTAKSKSNSKEVSSGPDSDSPRTESPQGISTGPLRQSLFTCSVEIKDHVSNTLTTQPLTHMLTPPISPEKLIPVLAAKCTMADKSTKTDDSFLNGDLEAACPTTTNAATMTIAVTSEAQPRQTHINIAANNNTSHSYAPPNRQDSRIEIPKQPSPPPPLESVNNLPRMSYAQVAQHHKELRAQKEKLIKEKQNGEQMPVPVTKQHSNSVNSNTNNSAAGRVQTEQRDCRDSKDGGQQRESPGLLRQGHSRNGSRSGYDRPGPQRRRPEQRASQLRDYVPPRSPK